MFRRYRNRFRIFFPRLKCNIDHSVFVRKFCSKSVECGETMKYLNVAEKNDAAKSISAILSKGNARRTEGLSKFNKLYSFDINFRGNMATMVMTSVSGHLMTYDFADIYRNWQTCDPINLFSAPIIKQCPENFINIKRTLEREIKSCQGLIIWTDCDREGENIGYEIIDVCKAVKPNIAVYRAKFSEITAAGIHRALNNVCQPDLRQSQAVDVRSELDLRIGAAFTRFQTMRYQRAFPDHIDGLVSYGSCQIPTLGFVARRFMDRESFIPQKFWKLKLTHALNHLTVEYNWDRHRLFDKNCCEALLMLCKDNQTAKVINVIQKPKNKWRPQAMDTIELEKLGSRKLKLSAKETMTIAEKLYSNGIISYPRTETNMFSSEIDLKKLVEHHVVHPNWGEFAQRVIQWGPNPRNGNKSDQAHPPIHPTKLTTELNGNEYRVYELICRHFLACVSRDAVGSETIVNVTVANEDFTATGLFIHERNYLDVYIYEKWNSKEILNYQIGNTFEPTELSMVEGSTSAPSLLTEADLIALMDKHGIGTDATHAEHINTIKVRGYIGEVDGGFLVPGILGMGLVEGYDSVNLPLAYPQLRAELERDLKLICTGERNPKQVLSEQVEKYKEVYKVITERIQSIDDTLAERFNERPVAAPQQMPVAPSIDPIFKCPACKKYHICLRTKKDNNGYFLSCMGKPECNHVIWLADIIKEMKVREINCPKCGGTNKKVTLKFKNMNSILHVLNFSNLGDDNWYTSCLLCDSSLQTVLNIQNASLRPNQDPANLPNTIRPTNRPTNSQNNNNNSSMRPSTSLPAQRQNNYRPRDDSNSSRNQSITGDNIKKCHGCNQTAMKLTVKKDGPNKGRQFYKCPKQPPCQFFEWADATSPQRTTHSAPQQRNPIGASENQGRAKRKCGICKSEGHTRQKCPKNLPQ